MSPPPIPREHVTGLVLAGGRGSRMGGVDKGLLDFGGRPLAQVALERLRPQVALLRVSANRHVQAYAAMGVPVVADAPGDYAGPLAGMLAGLQPCTTPWLATVPCDTPGFPADLVARLAEAAVREDAPIAMAATREPGPAPGGVQTHPVFCLIRADLRDSLAAFIAEGGRTVGRWTARHRCAQVVFEDAQAFFNANTPQELRAIQPSR